MLILTLLLAAPAAHGLPPCRPMQLRLAADDKDGEFDGMSHSGVELIIHNVGRDCALPVLPAVEMRDARGRLLPALRRPPPGLRRASLVRPLRLAAGHSAAIDLRWVSGPVYDPGRSIHAETVTVRIGAATLRTSLGAFLYGPAGERVPFDQSLARRAEDPAD